MGLYDRVCELYKQTTGEKYRGGELSSAFTWRHTREGHDYWSEISDIIYEWKKEFGDGKWEGKSPYSRISDMKGI